MQNINIKSKYNLNFEIDYEIVFKSGGMKRISARQAEAIMAALDSGSQSFFVDGEYIMRWDVARIKPSKRTTNSNFINGRKKL